MNQTWRCGSSVSLCMTGPCLEPRFILWKFPSGLASDDEQPKTIHRSEANRSKRPKKGGRGGDFQMPFRIGPYHFPVSFVPLH
jgi:hypothetical protein